MLRGLHQKLVVATWNLVAVSAFAERQRKTKKSCVEIASRRLYRMPADLYPAVRRTKSYGSFRESARNNIYDFSSYLKENILHLYLKAAPVNTI
jgi:hypothetical protein